MAKGEPQGRRSPLPVPYRSPWRGLLEALQAVAADLRLRLRGLWRRNLQGDLPRPRLWPAGLAPVFWPLILTLLLVGVVGLLAVLPHAWSSRALQEPLPTPSVMVPAAGVSPTTAMDAAPEAVTTASAGGDTGPSGSPASSEGVLPWEPQAELNLAPATTPTGQPIAVAPAYPGGRSPASPAPDSDLSAAAAGDAASNEAQSPPQLHLDPLLQLLSQGEDAELLLAARPEPARACLILTLSPAAERMSEPSLLERAERWRLRAEDAGYERLELRDGRGQLRGRQALVGSGMILLAPAPAA